jgi:hypothetical protein
MDIAPATLSAAQIGRGSHGRSGIRTQGPSARGLNESGWWGDGADAGGAASAQGGTYRSPGGGGVARGIVPSRPEDQPRAMSQIELERTANRQRYHDETEEK